MPLRYDSPEAIYVQKYCNKHYPDYEYDETEDKYYQMPSMAAEAFIGRYDSIIASLPKHFNKKEYYNFDMIQQCLEKINWGEDAVEIYANNKEIDSIRLKRPITLSKADRMKLRKEAFWGFLVFMYYATNKYFERQYITCKNEIEEVNKFITEHLGNLKVKLTAGRKSKEITNPLILAGIFSTLNYQDGNIIIDNTKQDIALENPMSEINILYKRTLSATGRYKSYIIIKTIMEEIFPKHPDLKYPKNESVLCLCVLHFCGYLAGQREAVCYNNNIITLMKLLKDFEKADVSMPNLPLSL